MKTKTLKTSQGEVEIEVQRDRDGLFQPQLIPKRKKDVSAIEKKVLAMYARGMSQRDIFFLSMDGVSGLEQGAKAI